MFREKDIGAVISSNQLGHSHLSAFWPEAGCSASELGSSSCGAGRALLGLCWGLNSVVLAPQLGLLLSSVVCSSTCTGCPFSSGAALGLNFPRAAACQAGMVPMSWGGSCFFVSRHLLDPQDLAHQEVTFGLEIKYSLAWQVERKLPPTGYFIWRLDPPPDSHSFSPSWTAPRPTPRPRLHGPAAAPASTTACPHLSLSLLPSWAVASVHSGSETPLGCVWRPLASQMTGGLSDTVPLPGQMTQSLLIFRKCTSTDFA